MDKLQRRRSYKALLERSSELRLASQIGSSSATIDEVSDIISESDRLAGQGSVSDHVSSATEVVMDAQVIKISHELLGEIVTKISTSEFSPEEYIAAIVHESFKGNMSLWESFRKTNGKTFSLHKGVPSFIGSFQSEHSENIEKSMMQKQRKPHSQTKTSRPENMKALKNDNKGASKLNWVLEQIRTLYKQNENKSISYYRLVIDPTDMMQTIDNIFQVAFLVSAGSLAINLDEHQLPAVKPILKSETKLKSKSVQAVSMISSQIYKDMIKHYNIVDSMLPKNYNN